MSVIISAKIIVVCFDMFEVSTFKFERFYACAYLTESLIFAKSVVYNSHSGGAWEWGYVLIEIACTSLVPRPNAIICGLETILPVCGRVIWQIVVCLDRAQIFCDSSAYIAYPHQSYIESLLTLWWVADNWWWWMIIGELQTRLWLFITLLQCVQAYFHDSHVAGGPMTAKRNF